MNWDELSVANLKAAQWLMKEHHYRAVCGRAYYAAYALVTARLPINTKFANQWNNPPHAKVPDYIAGIGELSGDQKRELKKAIRRLRQRREDSDYRPGISVTRSEAVESLRDAAQMSMLMAGGQG